jgi:hypothetical protein
MTTLQDYSGQPQNARPAPRRDWQAPRVTRLAAGRAEFGGPTTNGDGVNFS